MLSEIYYLVHSSMRSLTVLITIMNREQTSTDFWLSHGEIIANMVHLMKHVYDIIRENPNGKGPQI